jgi:hypothetical protein
MSQRRGFRTYAPQQAKLYTITSAARASRAGSPAHRSGECVQQIALPSYGTEQTDLQLWPNNKEGYASEETAMGAIGPVFQPELIKLMKAVLDEAAATLPESKRSSMMMAEMASQILACAAKGERDPATLTIAALLAVVECSHYSHDISPARRAV